MRAISLCTGCTGFESTHLTIRKNLDLTVRLSSFDSSISSGTSPIYTTSTIAYHSLFITLEQSYSRTSLAWHSSINALLRHRQRHLPSGHFLFYIPNKRPKAHRLSSSHFPQYPIPGDPVGPQPQRWSSSNRNQKDFFKDRSYGTAQIVKPSARRICSDSSLHTRPGLRGTLDYSLIVN